MMMDYKPLRKLQNLRIGYVPYSQTLDKPGDRRRFPYYASKRGLRFEIADPKKDYDLVILSERADVSVWSRYPQAKLVYDLIDSYFAIPRTDFKGLLRGLSKFLSRQTRYLQLDYWKAIASMCTRADAVVCSTEEQRHDILKFCPNVHIILDMHMDVARAVKSDYFAGRPFRIVWEGLPQNLGSLKLVSPVMDLLRERHLIEMHIVSDSEYFRYMGQYGKSNAQAELQRILPYVHFHEWKESDCADIICACDLAIIPLSLSDPFAAGKPENKLLLFWRMAMPVVTSASPAYVRAMRSAGLDSLTASNEADWLEILERLLGDEAARRRAGTLGKAYTEREFTEASLLGRWDAVFASLGFSL